MEMTKSIWPNVPGTELASLGWGQDGRRAVDSTMARSLAGASSRRDLPVKYYLGICSMEMKGC